jgi:hypothetical protein
MNVIINQDIFVLEQTFEKTDSGTLHKVPVLYIRYQYYLMYQYST